MRSFPDAVSSFRLACASRWASRFFYLVVPLLACIVLIRLVHRLAPRLVLLAYLPRSSYCVPLVVSFYPVSPAHRLVVSSCLLVSFFFSFVLSSCGYVMKMFLRGSATISSRWACVSFPRCPGLLASWRDAVSVPALRHPAMRRREDGKAWGEWRDELNKTARPQDVRQAVRHIGHDGTGRGTGR